MFVILHTYLVRFIQRLQAAHIVLSTVSAAVATADASAASSASSECDRHVVSYFFLMLLKFIERMHASGGRPLIAHSGECLGGRQLPGKCLRYVA